MNLKRNCWIIRKWSPWTVKTWYIWLMKQMNNGIGEQCNSWNMGELKRHCWILGHSNSGGVDKWGRWTVKSRKCGTIGQINNCLTVLCKKMNFFSLFFLLIFSFLLQIVEQSYIWAMVYVNNGILKQWNIWTMREFNRCYYCIIMYFYLQFY